MKATSLAGKLAEYEYSFNEKNVFLLPTPYVPKLQHSCAAYACAKGPPPTFCQLPKYARLALE